MSSTAKPKKIIYVDVDDVVADLVYPVVVIHNVVNKDNLHYDDITGWDITEFTRDNNKDIYEYFKDPRLYKVVNPVNNARRGVEYLRSLGLRVVFCTTSPFETPYVKFRWLQRHGFNPELEDYIEIQDKTLLTGEYMIDDKPDNILHSKTNVPIMFTRPWNKHIKWDGYRIDSWDDIITGKIDAFDILKIKDRPNQ